VRSRLLQRWTGRAGRCRGCGCKRCTSSRRRQDGHAIRTPRTCDGWRHSRGRQPRRLPSRCTGCSLVVLLVAVVLVEVFARLFLRVVQCPVGAIHVAWGRHASTPSLAELYALQVLGAVEWSKALADVLAELVAKRFPVVRRHLVDGESLARVEAD